MMNLKYVTEFSDILAAYVLGCLEERFRFACRYMNPEEAYIVYSIEEIQSRTECSRQRCEAILDQLELRGYLVRKHDLAGPDKLYLPHFKLLG